MLDKERQSILEDMGLNFLRFHNEEIKKDMDRVMEKIKAYASAFTKSK